MNRRVAIYTRVSTDEQTTANQVPEVEKLASARGEIVERYSEIGSAAKKRPAFESVLADARRGRFDTLVIWALDRFGRSMFGNMQDLLELDRLGVKVVSLRESWLDTAGPTRDLLVAICSWVAEQERERLIERTKAGMARARRTGTKSGKCIGRPKRYVDADLANRLSAEGMTQPEVARTLKVSLATLKRALARKSGLSSR